jgi:hypothetical protein
MDRLNAAIDAYESQAYGSDADAGELSRQRSLSLDAYNGMNIEPAPEGRSQVVDWTVFETIQWILPSLTRIYAAGDNIVEFEPTGPEDEDAAAQESEYLNYLVTQRNNWFLTVLTWCQDALLTKNAYCMVQMEEKLQPETESYDGQSQDQLAMLLEDDVELVAANQRFEGEDPVIDPMTQQPAVDPMTGQPLMQPRPVFDVQIRKVKAKKKLQFTVLPPERCKVGEDTRDFTLQDCNYFEYVDSCTLSDLRKQGLEIDDDISDDGRTETEESRARDSVLQSDNSDDLELPDPSMRRVNLRTIWIRYDYDEDGIAELQKVLRVGREVLLREEASRIPVACIVPFINTHRHMGSSVSDLLFDIQRIKTSILRSGLDSLNLSTRPGHLISNKVKKLDELLVRRPGGLVEIDTDMPDVQGHVVPLVTEFVLPQALEGLNHMDTVVESRVGVNRMFQGIDESAVNDHNRIGQLSTMAAQRVEQIARIFANGFERLFSLAHELIIKSGHQSEALKLRGKWVEFDPSQWKTGRDMRVVAPFSAGNKDSLIQRLMIIASIHEKALAGGLPIVDPQNAYNLAIELAKAADLSGTKFFTDPSTVPPPPPPPDHTMIALQIESEKVKNEAADEERQAQIEVKTLEIQSELDKYKADLQSQTQVWLAQIKAGQSVDLEHTKAKLRDAPILKNNDTLDETRDMVGELAKANSEQIAKLAEMVNELSKASNAPKEVVRDKAGKVVGVRRAQ